MQPKPCRMDQPGENPAEVCCFVLLEAGNSLLFYVADLRIADLGR